MRERTKRKFRMLATLIAMVLTLCMMCFGLWAATQVSYTGENTLTFEAKNVSADISGKVRYNGVDARTLTFEDGRTGETQENAVVGNFTTDYLEGQSYTGTVNLGNFNFENVTDVYTLHISVANTFDEEDAVSINATFTPQVTNNKSVTLADGTTVDYISLACSHDAGVAYTLAPGASVDFVVTLEINAGAYDQVRATGFSDIKFNFALSVIRAS